MHLQENRIHKLRNILPAFPSSGLSQAWRCWYKVFNQVKSGTWGDFGLALHEISFSFFQGSRLWEGDCYLGRDKHYSNFILIHLKRKTEALSLFHSKNMVQQQASVSLKASAKKFGFCRTEDATNAKLILIYIFYHL